MNNKTRKIFYSWLDFILSVAQIGSIIMVIYKFVILISCATIDFTGNIETFVQPIAAWVFVGGFVSLIRDRIETIRYYLDDEDDFDDEFQDEKE